MVLMHSWSSSVPVIGCTISKTLTGLSLFADCLRFEGSHFAEASQVPVRLTEPGIQKRLGQVPGNGRSHRAASHTNDVHVIVLDALPGREMVVDQSGANAWNLVGTDAGTHAAAADRHAAFHLASGDSLSEWNDEIGIVIARTRECAPKSTTSWPSMRRWATNSSFNANPP